MKYGDTVCLNEMPEFGTGTVEAVYENGEVLVNVDGYLREIPAEQLTIVWEADEARALAAKSR